MTNDQLQMLITAGLLAGDIVQKLVQEKYRLESTKGVSIKAMRRKKDGFMFLDPTFILKVDDCLKISIIQKDELKWYRHGPVKDVLLTLGQITPNKVACQVCPKCGDLLA